MAYPRDLPCFDCGNLMWRGATSLPQGEARCLPCRRAKETRVCEWCAAPFEVRPADPKRYCSRTCANSAPRRPPRPHTRKPSRVIRALDDARSSYRARVQDAPGLGQVAREKLRLQWIRQRRSCIYCTNLATTLDHVLPLVRGGTNHEGNLAPCCKRCNSSKSGWTVIEWRTGRRLGPMTEPLPWAHVRRTARRTLPRPPTGVQMALMVCDICGVLSQSKMCSYECEKVRVRNRYRSRVGIPLDAPLHSRSSSPRYVTSNSA